MRKRVHYGSRETGVINVIGIKVPSSYFILFLFSLLVSITFYTLAASTCFENFALNIVLGFAPSWMMLGFIGFFVIGKPPGYFFDLIDMTFKGNEYDPKNVPFYVRHRWLRKNPMESDDL